MGIIQFIEKVCVQTAVYWGNPRPDGHGGTIFDAAVEIACRWDSKVELIGDKGTTATGKVVVSKAQLLVTQDVQEQGWVYLGILDDLNSAQIGDPKEVDGAYEIKAFEKVPLFRSTSKFVRKAYL
jgi:hypothetical protein